MFFDIAASAYEDLNVKKNQINTSIFYQISCMEKLFLLKNLVLLNFTSNALYK